MDPKVEFFCKNSMLKELNYRQAVTNGQLLILWLWTSSQVITPKAPCTSIDEQLSMTIPFVVAGMVVTQKSTF